MRFDPKEEHVHLLVLDLLQLSISELVFRLKGTSSITIPKRKYLTVKAKLFLVYFCLRFLLNTDFLELVIRKKH
ncbi:transposase [Succinatimonas hippei]|uniref:transposase n=1 Tax=Succinatimonas hippei TaxID=626938 RepID=UPI0032EE0B87